MAMKIKNLLLEIKVNTSAWIEPNGTLHKMYPTKLFPRPVHGEYAINHFREFLSKEFDSDEMGRDEVSYDAVNNFLITNQYVRLANVHETIKLEKIIMLEMSYRPSQQSLQTLKEIFGDYQFNKIYCYIYDSSGIKQRFPKEFTNLENFINSFS